LAYLEGADCENAGSQPLHLRFAIDGASKGNPGPSGAGVVVMDVQGRQLAEIAVPLGNTTNNVAEYKALILASRKHASARRVE